MKSESVLRAKANSVGGQNETETDLSRNCRFVPILSLLSSGVHFVSERDFLQEKFVLFSEIICFWNIAVKI